MATGLFGLLTFYTRLAIRVRTLKVSEPELQLDATMAGKSAISIDDMLIELDVVMIDEDSQIIYEFPFINTVKQLFRKKSTETN